LRHFICLSFVFLPLNMYPLLAQEGSPGFIDHACILTDQPEMTIAGCTQVEIIDYANTINSPNYEIHYFDKGMYDLGSQNYVGGHWVSGFVAKDCVKPGKIEVYPNSMCFVKQKKQEADFEASVAAQHKDEEDQKTRLLIEEEARKREGAELKEQAKKPPPPGTTLYRGMYIGELLVSVKPNTCFAEFEAADQALASGLLRHACFLIANEQGILHTQRIAKIIDFVIAPAREVLGSLSIKYGAPLPGHYRMLDNELVPKWTIWKRPDGVLIGAKNIPALNGRGTYMEIVVLKRDTF
jgi:hypothetical protein